MNPINRINAVPGAGMMSPPPPRGQSVPLTDDQQGQLEEILARYDPENMTADSTRAMREDIKEAGIRPGEDLKNALEEAGFEVGPPPDARRGAMGVQPEPPQFVQEFIDKVMAGDVTDEDVASLRTALRTHWQTVTGKLVDQQY